MILNTTILLISRWIQSLIDALWIVDIKATDTPMQVNALNYAVSWYIKKNLEDTYIPIILNDFIIF